MATRCGPLIEGSVECFAIADPGSPSGEIEGGEWDGGLLVPQFDVIAGGDDGEAFAEGVSVVGGGDLQGEVLEPDGAVAIDGAAVMMAQDSA